MTTNGPVSREEFNHLVARLDQIDQIGTRGVAVLSVQVSELTKDFARHEKQHEDDARGRATSRRWMIGLVVAAIAAVDGTVVSLVLARGR